MIRLITEYTFEAAHHLPSYVGKCHAVHGHTYHLEVTVSGSVKLNPESSSHGMVCDFHEIDRIVNEQVISQVDHTDLNEKFHSPTAEILVQEFANVLREPFREIGVQLEAVRLWETNHACAEWRYEYNPGVTSKASYTKCTSYSPDISSRR